MPYPHSTHKPSPADYPDACESCLSRNIRPHTVHTTGDGVRAEYRCFCGNAWFTGWLR